MEDDTVHADLMALVDQLGTLEAALDEAVIDEQPPSEIHALLVLIAGTEAQLSKN